MPNISSITLRSMSPAQPIQGWMFIGVELNIFLLGVLAAQVYFYWITYKRDNRWIKLLILSLFALDCIDSGSIFIYIYRTLITFYGQPEHLAVSNWFWGIDPLISVITAATVQTFFNWRILVLTGRRMFSIVIGTLTLTVAVCGLVSTALAMKTPEFSRVHDFKPVVIVWLVSEMITDISITVILVLFLRSHKRGFRQTDELIDRIILVTVPTGLITTLATSFDLWFFIANEGGIFLMFHVTLSKLYTNSLLSSLNFRQAWQHSNPPTAAQMGSILFRRQREHDNERTATKDIHIEGPEAAARLPVTLNSPSGSSNSGERIGGTEQG